MAETSTKQVIASRQSFPIKRRRLLLLALVLFITGCMLNLFLCSAFADLFGQSLNISGATYGGGAPTELKNMDCPLFLSKQETGSFSAIVSNPTNSEHRADVTFSTYEFAQKSSEFHQVLQIPANSTTRVTWSVSFDRIGSHFVRVKLTNDDPTSRSYEQESFDYCGVAVLDAPGPQANVIVFVGIGALILAVAIAIYALRR
jgi:hypothetical protein